LYELQLFQWTASELRPEKNITGVLRSVLIESFVIHLRNLIDFFFTPTRDDDDVVATDFCHGWNEILSDTLKEAKKRANKELTHLTLGRKSDSDQSKPWKVTELVREVHGVAKRFAAKASPTKLSPEVPKFLSLSLIAAIAVVASTAYSNTTATVVTAPSKS
jgi:hypothetical protein